MSLFLTVDGNKAVASVAYRVNEIVLIYPITPATSFGEWADSWAAQGVPNVDGNVPEIFEMQSEAGVIGAMHGALQGGSLVTTSTSSQGLLLMIPDLFHISAELSPTVIHVASRAVAGQGMTIYAEHSDVMSTRMTGFALLCSASVQEAQDFALLAQAVALKTRVPFIHFFDGFRTSHEVSKIRGLSDEDLRSMIDPRFVEAHRVRRLSPEAPVTRGTIQNADTYFQGRESVNPFYDSTPGVLQETMDQFYRLTGRQYHLIDYVGHPEAERVVVLMGSGAETAHETVEALEAQGEKVGVLKVRLFQPFPSETLLRLLPKTCRAIAVLDRTKEPGAGGEPLYQKVASAVMQDYVEHSEYLPPKVVGGRFGLSGKELTPGMVKAILDELKARVPKHDFTIGIQDDVTHTSLSYDRTFEVESGEVKRALFYGLGSDGTVSATKNVCEIIGAATEQFVQAHFVFDARKTGSRTVSHLRVSPQPIRSEYLISSAHFVGCHQFNFLRQIDVLKPAARRGIFLLNSPYPADAVWEYLPQTVQRHLIEKELEFYVIDATAIAESCQLGPLVSGIMQVCFFALSRILDRETAIREIKAYIQQTFGKKGEAVIARNFSAVDQALEHLRRVTVPKTVTSTFDLVTPIPPTAPLFVRQFVSKVVQEQGDDLPVSQVPNDGTFPAGTMRFEKRDVALTVPVWDKDACLQCGRCVFYCPHAAIRSKTVDARTLEGTDLPSAPAKSALDKRYVMQVFPDGCTGCAVCVQACPVQGQALAMRPKESVLDLERKRVERFETLPYACGGACGGCGGSVIPATSATVSSLQSVQPLFEFSSACAGCGETPYIKLLSQLFGDRAIIANACGCSSVFGGHLPTSPWAKNQEGCGPAYSSSLFEDNAEFGLGFALADEKCRGIARELVQKLSSVIGPKLTEAVLHAPQQTPEEISTQRARVAMLKTLLEQEASDDARQLLAVVDFLVQHSVWAVGGDGWAYDIGFGGIDHVIASGKKINILVLDTEVYSNTGGQSSKSTPRGSVVKFAAGGKKTPKKDLGLMAMTYGIVYVAEIALGANPKQAIQAFQEAGAYPGPALIIAYCPCIAHGISMIHGLEQQRLAVQSGYWPLYRFNPDRIPQGLNPMQLDSGEPTEPLETYLGNENRFRILAERAPEEYARLLELTKKDIARKMKQYRSIEEWYRR